MIVGSHPKQATGEMAIAHRLRRTRKPSAKALVAKTCRVQKRYSLRLQRAKTIRYASDLDDFEHRTGHTPAIPEVQTHRRKLICDSASDSESEEEPESDELEALSSNNIEYNSGDQLDRRGSYDSRIESGNEDYELDDFVVNDDEVDGISDVNSEITIVPEGFIEEQRMNLFGLAESSQMDVEVRVCNSPTSSDSGSGLFVNDPNDRPEYIAALSSDDVVSQPVLMDVSPADVAEEIMDAVCRFSRRCNRDSAPLRLMLASDILEDKDVVDSLQSAIKQGLGRVEAMGNNRILVVVGPNK